MRKFLRVFGVLLIVSGLTIGGVVVFNYWQGTRESAKAIEQARQDILNQWNSPSSSPRPIPSDSSSPGPDSPVVSGGNTKPSSGHQVNDGIGFLYIPRLSNKVWQLPIVEGVGAYQLSEGAGHYPGTAMPGEIGNFAVAAHRMTHTEAFTDVDQLQPGDLAIVQTKGFWYVYSLDKYQIVNPSDMWVVDPVPGSPNAVATQALFTMTTCTPKWSSSQRWVWWGHLVRTVPATQGPPPEISKGP